MAVSEHKKHFKQKRGLLLRETFIWMTISLFTKLQKKNYKKVNILCVPVNYWLQVEKGLHKVAQSDALFLLIMLAVFFLCVWMKLNGSCRSYGNLLKCQKSRSLEMVA